MMMGFQVSPACETWGGKEDEMDVSGQRETRWLLCLRVPWKDPAGRLSVRRRGTFKVSGVSREGAHSGSGITGIP